MKQIGMRFLLTHGSFMDIITTDDVAKYVIKKWASGEYKLRDRQILNGDTWAVKMDDVIGIHVLEIKQAGQQGPMYARPNVGGSGL